MTVILYEKLKKKKNEATTLMFTLYLFMIQSEENDL